MRGKQDKEQTLDKKVNTHHGSTKSVRAAWGNVKGKEEVAGCVCGHSWWLVFLSVGTRPQGNDILS